MNLLRLLPLLAALLLGTEAVSQERNTWEIFAGTKFREIWIKEFKDVLPVPEFDQATKALEGKVVTLTGYVIPATEAPGFQWIVLSRYTFANCFFCGKAGAESIAEIQLKGKRPRFRMDDRYTFRGRLRLNKDDWEHLHFILEDAEIVR